MKKFILSVVTTSLLTATAAIAQEKNASNFTYPQGVYNGEVVNHATYESGGIVNAKLIEKLALTQPEAPYVTKVDDGIWAIVGYHWGYKAVIEGENGLIIYDTGDDIEEAEEIITLIKTFSDKPIKTVIYSHAHYAFGTQAIVDAYGDDITVIGHPALNANILESGGLGAAIPELSPTLLARTLEQFSMLLPEEGPDAKAPTPVGKTKGFVPVNTPVTHGQAMTVDGVEMVFYTDYDSDTNDQTIVYLPESRTVLNNHLWPTFPNVYTLRGSVYRDPTDWAGGIKLIRDLNPKHLINTHSVNISGEENVQQALSGYYDAIMYLYDQTLRGILHGKTPEELRYWVQMPKDLAEQPNNLMAYGELSYYPAYIYNYALGWFGRDTEVLNRIAPDEQAQKIIEGFGGPKAVKAELKNTLETKQYAWSAELAGYLVKVMPNDQESRQLLADAMRQMGYNTEASIPRSYYLSKALEMEGKIHIPAIMFTGPESVLGFPAATTVEQYRVRLDPKVSYGEYQLLAIEMGDENSGVMGMHVRSGVAEFITDLSQYSQKPDMTIKMSMDAWAGYFVGDITLDELLVRKDVKTSDKTDVKRFFGMFDQVHPSKAALIPASTLQ
ncbi:alkyl sulfatase dimerization domain-containing protein [Moritella sp. Urea-trap-13]|uniref:alkyl sulfatase dimerization domain-containing protein n=1 Tax=Moritella sp. Urea-trap-13 TaxID=2058327 RepID=UPI000C33F357|nr:alkyl sulfatase dimerization domain-containing protein [Moritella sp. Urea-trap-13]PKH06007.1 alkyl sulfatase [Moritella sp. Urea-trap-13]